MRTRFRQPRATHTRYSDVHLLGLPMPAVLAIMGAQAHCGMGPEWDSYFIEVAKSVGRKSKDTHCKVGAVIVNRDGLIISTGFNGLPRKIPDESQILENKDEKLLWIVHAEHNAIINAARSGICTLDCTMYVDKFPCFACLLAIVQAGIGTIYTDDKEYWKNDPLDGVGRGNHEGKRYIIQQAELTIVAPNHPEYLQSRTTQRPLLAPKLTTPMGTTLKAASTPALREQDDAEHDEVTEIRPRSVAPNSS